MKKHVFVGGLNLVEIDIANSQPLILNTLLTHETKDSKRYKKICEEGVLWDYLQPIFGYNDRGQLKEDMFHAVFYSPSNSKLTPELRRLRDIFKDLFPDVYRQIVELKTPNYKMLPVRMQQIEADIILNDVCKTLLNENIYFLTVHDSIITDEQEAEYVSICISHAFNKYKINPKTRIKYLA